MKLSMWARNTYPAISSILPLFLWLLQKAMRKLPMNETTVDTKRIIFCPCSTVRAVDYEML